MHDPTFSDEKLIHLEQIATRLEELAEQRDFDAPGTIVQSNHAHATAA